MDEEEIDLLKTIAEQNHSAGELTVSFHFYCQSFRKNANA